MVVTLAGTLLALRTLRREVLDLMERENNRILGAFTAFIYAFLFAPIVVLIIFSFNASRRNFVWLGFTTDWYPKLLANRDLLDALSVTMRVAVIAVIGSTILGTLLGLGLARLRFRGSGATETLILLPMVTPEIIMGISLLILFSQLFAMNGSLLQISIAHITFCVSYVAVTVRARAAGMDPRLEEAARDLGSVGRSARSGTSPCRSSHRRSRPARCSPSRSRSTTWSSPRSTPASARPPCRSTSTARSSSGSRPRSTRSPRSSWPSSRSPCSSPGGSARSAARSGASSREDA